MGLEGILARALNQKRSIQAASPSGLFLGVSESLIGQGSKPFCITSTPAQHSFICGRTGSGKTTLLLRLMTMFLQHGLAFFFIDFHGPATDALLAAAATLGVKKRIILVEPWADCVAGWNPLRFQEGESSYAVVQELVSIFHRRLWPDSWGPRLEELLRMTLVALAEARLTLLDASIFLSRPEFRRAVLRHVTISEVREYWTLRFERISPSQRALITESVLNKLAVFQDPAIKYVVGQQDGALNFDRALAEGQIILGNISSGALRGNTFLLAALLTASFRNAVYRRHAVAGPYAAILDEFQEMIAIEALDDYLRSFRKSKVSVYLGTQTLQLPPELRSSIFGNCSRFFAFATSAADASALTKEFGGQEAPLVGERLPELKTGQAFVKVRGEAVRLLRVAAPDCEPTLQRVEEGRSLCLRLGSSHEQIDKEIEQRRNRFMPSAGSANRDAEDVRQDQGTTDLPEGYEGY